MNLAYSIASSKLQIDESLMLKIDFTLLYSLCAVNSLWSGAIWPSLQLIKQNIYLQKIVLEIVQKSKAATAAVQGSQHLLALLEFEPLSP